MLPPCLSYIPFRDWSETECMSKQVSPKPSFFLSACLTPKPFVTRPRTIVSNFEIQTFGSNARCQSCPYVRKLLLPSPKSSPVRYAARLFKKTALGVTSASVALHYPCKTGHSLRVNKVCLQLPDADRATTHQPQTLPKSKHPTN
jgi:hypothetical protein